MLKRIIAIVLLILCIAMNVLAEGGMDPVEFVFKKGANFTYVIPGDWSKPPVDTLVLNENGIKSWAYTISPADEMGMIAIVEFSFPDSVVSMYDGEPNALIEAMFQSVSGNIGSDIPYFSE